MIMRILILSFFYYPEPNDIKIHLLGKELAQRGHEVTAVTTFPNYPHGQIYPGYKQSWRQWEDKDGVKLLRLPLYPDHSRSSLKRALSYLSFMVSAALLTPLLTRKADVMWIYHPPLTTGIAGWWISLLKRTPFIYEIQDMWPEALIATGMLSNERALKVIAAACQFIYGRAAALTVNSPGYQQNLLSKGIPADKVHVLPNWADEAIYRPVDRDPALGEQHGLSGKFNVIFGGNMGPAQGLHTVIEAAKLLQDTPDVQFVLIGDGLDLDSLQTQAQGLNNVRFIPRQPAENMPGFFAWGDALLVHLKDDPLIAMTIPSKTTAYLACGRPIIGALSGDGAGLIEAAQAGIVCPPGDAVALAQAVKRLYTTPRSERELFGQQGRSYFLANLTRHALVDRYETLFKAIVDE